MPIKDPTLPANDARQELRQLAKGLNFEMRQLGLKVDAVRALLFGEARAIRAEARSKPRRRTQDATTKVRVPQGSTTKKGQGEG